MTGNRSGGASDAQLPASERPLRHDQRGAIMLIAVFFAILGVALLYLVIGTAVRVEASENLLGAADASALSSGVLLARGMNLEVLINLIMAALMAILVTMKLLEGLAIIGIALAAAAAFFTAGSSLAAIPPLKSLQSSMSLAYEETKPSIDSALEVLHTTADTVKTMLPDAAAAVAGSDFAGGNVTAVMASAGRADLPIEDDEFSVLCGKAGEFPVTMAGKALEKVPGIGLIMGELGGPMGELTSSLSEWFCGESESGSSTPKPYPNRVKREYPRMPQTLACENEAPPPYSSKKQMQAATSPACTNSQAFEKQSAVDKDKATGECKAHNQCGLNEPYDQRVTAARVQCKPRGDFSANRYDYQVQNGKVVYRKTKLGWIRGVPEFYAPRMESSGAAPCFNGQQTDIRRTVAVGWQEQVHPRPGSSEVLPLCTTERSPENHGLLKLDDAVTEVVVTFTQVTHLIGCMREEDAPVNFNAGSTAGQGSDARSSKRLLSGTKLGDGNFQIRSLAVGSEPAGESARLIRLALFGNKEPERPLPQLAPLVNSAMAQAEYFYDGTEAEGEQLWNMKWRARLRRFTPPKAQQLKRFKHDANSLGGQGVAAALAILGLGDVSLH